MTHFQHGSRTLPVPGNTAQYSGFMLTNDDAITNYVLTRLTVDIFDIAILMLTDSLHFQAKIRWALEEGPPGCEKLRGICSILHIWPPFAMESYYSHGTSVFSYFGSSKGSIFHFSCLMSQVLLDGLLYPKKRQIAIPPLGSQDLGWPQNPMKIHQISSQSPGQQNSWKLVSRLPKIMRNRSWNHEKSNFCKSWFLQYLPCQMLVFAISDTQM